MNNRSDEYGGSLENRLRLTRELLEETRDAIGDSCGIAFRFAVDELKGKDGMQFQEEGRAVVEMLAEHPDLWDVNVSDWSNDSQTSRFQPEEAYQMPYVEFVKSITTKPVVGVGRLTIGTTGVGAARPGVTGEALRVLLGRMHLGAPLRGLRTETTQPNARRSPMLWMSLPLLELAVHSMYDVFALIAFLLLG